MADEKSNPPKDEKENAAAPAAAPAGGGFKAWLPLLVTIFLMPALAFGMTQFVILPQLQKGLGVKTTATAANGGLFNFGASKKADTNNKKETVTMNKLLVNVAGTMGARYLLVSLSIAGTGPQFKEKITEHDAQLRDAACGVLAAKTLADLEKPGTRNQIRTELLTGFNNILGDSSAQDIYFTEFAIQ
jgi:flagellar FliL protein